MAQAQMNYFNIKNLFEFGYHHRNLNLIMEKSILSYPDFDLIIFKGFFLISLRVKTVYNVLKHNI